MVADGDKLLADGKYEEARKKFLDLKKYAKDLRNVGSAPVTPRPAEARPAGQAGPPARPPCPTCPRCPRR